MTAPQTSARSFWQRQRWLILRRATQAAILLLFWTGPLLGVWLVKGNLNYSLTLDTLPLTDPFVLLQSLCAGHWPASQALIGAALVLLFYALVGGRVYCAWVCPLNVVTDLAAWLRARLNIKGGVHVSRHARHGILALALALAALTGSLAWELVNPVSWLQRGLIFGMGAAWFWVLGVFAFDLFVMARGWCGHLCPVGAFYGLLGRTAQIRVRLPGCAACDDCNDCYAACPEPLIIHAPLKDAQAAPVINSGLCSNCGRCIDVCQKAVFAFGIKPAREKPQSA